MQMIGFEPTRVSPSGFKPDAFSNYATSANRSRQDSDQSIIDLVSSLAMRRYKPLTHATILFFYCQTETQGFEPWNRIPGLQFSRLLQSTTLPNLPHAVSGS